MIVRSMWIGPKLSRMERACMLSFVKLGYQYELYTYQEVENVPSGITICDGNEILPSERIFQYKGDSRFGGGSYSGFSNYFRFKLLTEKGGWWVDADIYCLNPLPEEETILINESTYLASCMMKTPAGSKFAKRCYEICENKDPTTIKWGETGPALVTSVASELGITGWSQSDFLPLLWTEVDKFFDSEDIPNSYSLHFWNEIWRRKGLDKNAIFPSNCLYEKLIAKANQRKL